MRKFMLAFVCGALLLPGSGFTVGLGEIEVNSALNQELDAEIALLSTTQVDAEQMIVKLASSEDFSRAGIDRPYLLTSLRFSVFDKNGSPYIKVSSPRPIREPFLNFLVEIDWPQGHLLREYTILLDPPVFMGADQTSAPARPAATDAARPAQSAATAPAATSSGRPGTWAPAPAPAAAPAATSTQPSTTAVASAPAPVEYSRPAYAPADGYRIQQGDTAWSLANKLRPDESVSVEQMMMAMLRSNPEVFINGNVNGLKRGYILRVPDRATMGALEHNEAVAMVREQNALWREYQAELASGAPASSISTASSGAASSTAMDDSADARLNIVSAGTGTGMAGDKDPTAMSQGELRAQLALANEQLETERLEKEALVGKVNRLEGQVDKMKRMLSIEDQGMAEMQQAQMPGEAPADVAAEAPAEAMAEESTDVEAAAEGMTEDTGETAVAEDGAEAPVGEEAMAEGEAATAGEGEGDAETEAQPVVAEQPVFVDETTSESADTTPQEATQASRREIMDTMPSDFVTPAKPDPLDVILNNPIVLAVIAFGVLLIGGLAAFFVKKRKAKAADDEPAPAPLPVEDELEDVADMVDDDALAQEISDDVVEAEMADAEAAADEDDFDAESTMILPSAEDTVISSTEELAGEEEDERDDVIAEADVYLAYGIYQQAEELLNNAINENPDRDAYRVKLAETHYASKNADGFIAAATGLKDQSGIDTKAWAKVAAMGKDLCPDESMFTAGAVTGDVDLDDLMPKVPEPEMDIDLAGDDAGDTTPDLDFSLDDAPLDLPDAGDDSESLDLGDLDTAEESSTENELEFDLSETDAVEEAKDDTDDFSLDIGADELDLGETAQAATEEEPEIDLSAELESTAIIDADDMPEQATEAVEEIDLDLDLGLDDAVEEATETAAEAAEEIDLDLGLDDEPAAESAAEEAIDLSADLGDDDLGDLGDVDEVATKLDLARAYLDMGDAEGTRSILDEVMSEGNDEQKKEAQEILDQL